MTAKSDQVYLMQTEALGEVTAAARTYWLEGGERVAEKTATRESESRGDPR